MEKIKLLIADYEPIFRQGIRRALEKESDIDVVAEARNGAEAIDRAKVSYPDVILLDVNIPEIDGMQVARDIKPFLPCAAIVFVTSYDDEDQLFEAIKVGALSYHLKDVRTEELLEGIRWASRGEYLIDSSVMNKPAVAAKVLKQFRDLWGVGRSIGYKGSDNRAMEQRLEPTVIPLSTREIEVLGYVARGNSNKEIARTLGISDQTVKNHINSILRKLVVNDRTQAVVYALRRGWIKMQNL